MDDRDKEGRFLPNHEKTPGSGRPKEPSTVAKALEIFYCICNRPENLELLRVDMQADFEKGPMKFFAKYIFPFASKELVGAIVDAWGVLTPTETSSVMDKTTVGEKPSDV